MLKFTPIYENFSSYDVAYFNKQTDWLLKSVMMIDLETEPHFLPETCPVLRVTARKFFSIHLCSIS